MSRRFASNDKYTGTFYDWDEENDVQSTVGIEFKFSYFNSSGATREDRQLVKGWVVTDDGVMIKTSADLPFTPKCLVVFGRASSYVTNVVANYNGHNMGGDRFTTNKSKYFIINIG